jgi:hypothetical protein
MVPVPSSQRRICAHEYYEALGPDGGGMQFCAICDSNGAIGRCANHYRMVCGYCSEMIGGRRLCKVCAARIAADAAADQERAKAAAAESELAAARAQIAPSLAVLAALKDIHDEADRILVLMMLSEQLRRMVSRFSAYVLDVAHKEVLVGLVSAARSAFANPNSLMWDLTSDSPAGWTCNGSAILAHFREIGRSREDTLTALIYVTYEKRPLRGYGTVKYRAEGWKISPLTVDREIYVLTDGTLVDRGSADREFQTLKHHAGGQVFLQLSDVHKLIKEGHIAVPLLPRSMSLDSLPGVTVPWSNL